MSAMYQRGSRPHLQRHYNADTSMAGTSARVSDSESVAASKAGIMPKIKKTTLKKRMNNSHHVHHQATHTPPKMQLGMSCSWRSTRPPASFISAKRASIGEYSCDMTSHHPAEKRPAAKASGKGEASKKKPRLLCNKQQFSVGTIISKQFKVADPKGSKYQHFLGEVKAYFPGDKLYHVVYDDGDSEDMSENEIAQHLIKEENDNNKAASTATINAGRKRAVQKIMMNDGIIQTERLNIGDVVYSTCNKTGTKDQTHQSALVFRRGTVEAMRQDRRSLTYDIKFVNGQHVKSIDKSLVIPEHIYLHENLKQNIEFGERVVAAWWVDPLDTKTPPAGWFPGIIKACRKQAQGGRFGPTRFYDVEFDDGDVLDDIEDIFVFPETEYSFLSREISDETFSGWKGVKNVLDNSSADRWAKTVGYWELDGKNDGQNHIAFPYLGDALRYHDNYVVSRRGAETQKHDLNLPEEWIFYTDANCSPIRYDATKSFFEEEEEDALEIGTLKYIDIPRDWDSDLEAESLHAYSPCSETGTNESSRTFSSEAGFCQDSNVEEGTSSPESQGKHNVNNNIALPTANAELLRRKKYAAANIAHRNANDMASMDRLRRIKVIDYVPASKPRADKTEKNQNVIQAEEFEDKISSPSPPSVRDKRVKPTIGRGEHVYAVLKRTSASSIEQNNWSLGRVWDYKVKEQSSYGPVKTYDIIFDNGEVERNLDEVWIVKKKDYASRLLEDSWIGVTNRTDPNSDDEYARTIGWYHVERGESEYVYNSIYDALKAHDKYIISLHGQDNVSDEELNFPQHECECAGEVYRRLVTN